MPPGANDPHEMRHMSMPPDLRAPGLLADALARATDARALCQAACAAAAALPGAEGAAVILWAEGSRVVAEAGLASGAAPAVEECARDTASPAVGARLIHDAATLPDGPARSAFLSAGVRALCLAPVTVGGARAGVIAACRSAPGVYGDAAAEGAVSIAASAAGAMERLVRDRALRAERDLLAGGPLVVFRWRNAPGWPVEYVSANVQAVLGIAPEDFTSGRVSFASVIHPDDAPRVLAATAAAADAPPPPGEAAQAPLEQHYRLVRPDGRTVHVRDATRIVRDGAGRVTHHDGYLLEVAATEDRRPSMPGPAPAPAPEPGMEGAVRLAGGIAHEFNNLLTAIGGSAARALERLPSASPARGDVERILGAVDRATVTTRKLLAISGRQVAAPRGIDLSAAVRAAEPRLRRLAPPGVRWRADLAPDLWPVRADAGQVEEALACLVANAGEAMPSGGVLTIRTENMPALPGGPRGGAEDRVALSVNDTGTGLDGPMLARLAEPFFTTKPYSAGLGLGLPTVRAIAQRWGATFHLDCDPGRGTTACIFWPRSRASQADPMPAPTLAIHRSGETILLAEDQDLVRRLMAAMLRDQGYTVLEAEDGPAALRVAEGHEEPIHLLLTDAVMPGMDGVEVAGRLRRARPGVKTLVVSGFTEDVALRNRVEEGTVQFLAKPFTPDELGRAVRRVLDAPAPAAG